MDQFFHSENHGSNVAVSGNSPDQGQQTRSGRVGLPEKGCCNHPKRTYSSNGIETTNSSWPNSGFELLSQSPEMPPLSFSTSASNLNLSPGIAPLSSATPSIPTVSQVNGQMGEVQRGASVFGAGSLFTPVQVQHQAPDTDGYASSNTPHSLTCKLVVRDRGLETRHGARPKSGPGKLGLSSQFGQNHTKTSPCNTASSQSGSVIKPSSWTSPGCDLLSQSPEKSPLGHFSASSLNFNPGSGSTVSRRSHSLSAVTGETAGAFLFDARNLFSTTQHNRALDTEEAMEIDNQEEEETRGSSIGTESAGTPEKIKKPNVLAQSVSTNISLTSMKSDNAKTGAGEGKNSLKSKDEGEVPANAKVRVVSPLVRL